MTRHSGKLKCPQCGSRDVRFAHKNEEPPHELVLRRFVKCLACGFVFLPMSRKGHSAFLIASGAALAALTIDSMLRGPTVAHLVFCGLLLLWPLRLLAGGIRGVVRKWNDGVDEGSGIKFVDGVQRHDRTDKKGA